MMVLKSCIVSKAVQTQFLRSSVMMDGVPSRVNVFLADSVLSWLISLLFFWWIVSYPWSLAPELQEDRLGTNVISMNLC